MKTKTETKSPRQKWKEALFKSLEPLRMHSPSYTPDSTELYLSGFATVQLSISDRTVDVERYYDNEIIDVDMHRHHAFPITEDTFPDPAMLLDLCTKLVKTIREDEPILNFGE